jgi:hypothetical protein
MMDPYGREVFPGRIDELRMTDVSFAALLVAGRERAQYHQSYRCILVLLYVLPLP